MDSNVSVATIRAGVAMANWKTATEATKGGNISSVSFDGQSRQVAFVNANEDKHGNSVVVVSHNFDGYDVRLLAVDLEGQEHIGRSIRLNNHVTVTFPDLSIDFVTRFLFQARPYEWVVFKNIRLQSAIFHGVRNDDE
ncbi:MAG TPA: hypothetical protein EYQ50_09950 [Verrucomicrobiales bacterium]|nr:hypothetical protein [Verrucomicrobiales bacterium]